MEKVKKEKKFNDGMKLLFRYYRKHLGFFIGYIIILTIQAVINFFEAMTVANCIACIMDSGDYKGALIQAGITLTLTICNSLLSILNTFFFKQLENRTKIDIQQNILSSSLDIQMKTYDTMGSGIIVTRLTADIDCLSTEFKSITTNIINLLKRASYVIYVFALNMWLGLFLIGTVILTILLSWLRVYNYKKLKPLVKSSAEKVNSKIIEVVRGVKDIKTLNCADSTLELLKLDQQDYCKKDNKEWYVGVALCQATNILKYTCNFFFIALCIYFLKWNALTPLVFYTCFLYKDHILDFAQILEDLRLNLATVSVYANRIFMLTDSDYYDKDTFGDKNIDDYSGKITFKNVCFGYNKDSLVLDKASFEIMPKETVAFVGESGSGKSTIINLISHLYYKTSGKIYFDDTEIEELSRDFIKNNIAVVNQFPYIFNLSIRDNFKIINPDITDEEILSLCKQTNILNHIKKLPNGLDSVIGENACQFSGGQKQKLCIARALARNVKILIFDEATSALDNTNQKEIMRVIEKLKDKITVIIIAHRLSTITYADQIFMLEGGKIVAQGTHDELIKNSEIYHNLYLSSQKETNS